MNFSKLGVAKFIISGIVGIGTGKIVGKIIKDSVNPETLIEKVTVTAAGWVIGAIATERTKAYTNDMIDNVVEMTTGVIDKVKTNEKLKRISKNESTFEQEGLDPSRFQKNENNIWVLSTNEKTLTSDEIVEYFTEILRTREWSYDDGEDAWVKKNANGKIVRKFRPIKGTSNWVLTEYN